HWTILVAPFEEIRQFEWKYRSRGSSILDSRAISRNPDVDRGNQILIHRLTRCELPGADDDPCCSRKPKCPNPCLKPGEQQENTCQYSDCPDRPEPPDPCKIGGEICSEEDCSFKKKERCCSDKPADCCPRMQKK
ncbi:unnamed protein product, partial [Nesidiocoris tenuis]